MNSGAFFCVGEQYGWWIGFAFTRPTAGFRANVVSLKGFNAMLGFIQITNHGLVSAKLFKLTT